MSEPGRRERRGVLLRLDPAVHEAIAAWAAQDLRSLNAQVEWLLRQALDEAGRLPRHAGDLPRRGRPRKPDGGKRDGERTGDQTSRVTSTATNSAELAGPANTPLSGGTSV